MSLDHLDDNTKIAIVRRLLRDQPKPFTYKDALEILRTVRRNGTNFWQLRNFLPTTWMYEWMRRNVLDR